jgi:hypothetical protein
LEAIVDLKVLILSSGFNLELIGSVELLRVWSSLFGRSIVRLLADLKEH